jgi:hypothetical protein
VLLITDLDSVAAVGKLGKLEEACLEQKAKVHE